MTEPFPVDLEAIGCPLGCTSDDRAILTGYDRLHGLPVSLRSFNAVGAG